MRVFHTPGQLSHFATVAGWRNSREVRQLQLQVEYEHALSIYNNSV